MQDRVVKLHFKIEKHADIQRFRNSSQSVTYIMGSYHLIFNGKKKSQHDTKIGLDK